MTKLGEKLTKLTLILDKAGHVGEGGLDFTIPGQQPIGRTTTTTAIADTVVHLENLKK